MLKRSVALFWGLAFSLVNVAFAELDSETLPPEGWSPTLEIGLIHSALVGSNTSIHESMLWWEVGMTEQSCDAASWGVAICGLTGFDTRKQSAGLENRFGLIGHRKYFVEGELFTHLGLGFGLTFLHFSKDGEVSIDVPSILFELEIGLGEHMALVSLLDYVSWRIPEERYIPSGDPRIDSFQKLEGQTVRLNLGATFRFN